MSISAWGQADQVIKIERAQPIEIKEDRNLAYEGPKAALRSNSCNCIEEPNGDLLICENFQEYQQGAITPQSNRWSLWPGATRDGFVDGSGTNQYLRLKHSNGAESDVYLDLENQTSGQYKLSFRLWTWEGFSAYFNIQHDNNLNSTSDANWAYHVQFINGQGRLSIGSFRNPSATATFAYRNNGWNYIEQIIDLDQDKVTLTINDVEVDSWQFSLGTKGPQKQLGAIDFFANSEFNAQFVVDNICLVRLQGDPPPPVEFNLTCASRGEIVVDREALTLTLRDFAVRNTGPAPAPATRLGYYMSTNLTFTTKDYLAATADIPALAPGQVATFDLDLNLKDVEMPDDTYYFGTVIDDIDVAAETNESDNNDCYWSNFRFIYITNDQKTNLACSSSGQLTLDQKKLKVSNINLANISEVDADASEIGLYLSTDNQISINDYLLGTITAPSLSSNTNATFDFEIDLDTLTELTEGDYVLGIIMDHLNVVEESEETDNTCSFESTLIPIREEKEELIANLSCFFPGDMAFNKPEITIENLVVENQGDLPTGSFALGFFLSTNRNITTNDFLLEEIEIDDLQARSAIRLNPTIDVSQQNIPAGTYYLGMIIDHREEVIEFNENDNRGCKWTSEDPIVIEPNTTPDQCNCTDPYDNDICEDFEIYQAGFASNQSPCINNGSGTIGGDDEAIITNARAFEGNFSMGIRENGLGDALFLLGEKEAGTYTLEWVMYIPSGKTAYYTLQELHQPGITKLEVSFSGNGRGQIVDYGTNFNYPSDQWFRIKHIVNMDMNHVSVYINNQIVEQNIPFFYGLGSVQFLSADNRSTYFIDNFIYKLLFRVQNGKVVTMGIPNSGGIDRDQSRFQVYPNPARQTLFIDYLNPSSQSASLQLINELGQVVWEGQIPPRQVSPSTLDLSPFKKGLYYLTVQSEGNKQIKKVVIQ
ncbi:MAG: hypothetical protein Sapg2KO_35800 [Saprospiraceae bacterium]